jgi:hypothetical protein
VITMPRTLQEILEHDEELADRFETSDPDTWTEIPIEDEAERRLAQAARARAHAEHAVADSVAFARQHNLSWRRIGDVLGTSAQAAQKRYGA